MKGKDLQPRLFYPAKLSFRMEGQIKSLPDKVKLKEFIITKPLLYEMLKRLIYERKKINTMNSKMTTNSQLSTTESKTNKQSKQSTRTGTESQKWEITWRIIREGGRGREGEKVQRISSINGRWKIDRGRLRIV